jgi:hypothetical protein
MMSMSVIGIIWMFLGILLAATAVIAVVVIARGVIRT